MCGWRGAFLVLAVIGLALSMAVHSSTFLGIDPIDVFRPIWLLHVGIFVVFIPGLIAVVQASDRKGPGNRSFPLVLSLAPRWMLVLLAALFVYGIINFAIFAVVMREGNPEKLDNGRLVIANGSRIVREINEEEFRRYRAFEARGPSGHWMVFYCLAMTMLATGIRAVRVERQMAGKQGGKASPVEDVS